MLRNAAEFALCIDQNMVEMLVAIEIEGNKTGMLVGAADRLAIDPAKQRKALDTFAISRSAYQRPPQVFGLKHGACDRR